MRVAYLGPEGTVSHEALRSVGGSFEEVPQPTLEAAVLAVRDGAVDRALVPIENALEGSVDPVLDALVFDAEDLVIVGELKHPVHFCLVGVDDHALDAISAVVSHPQASGQCARFLREVLPHATVLSAPSTADAVRQVFDNAEPDMTALGTRGAAELYGCVILRENVEDHPDNETRFVWLARAGTASRDGDHFKTALLFWGAGSSGPGWLVRCLSEFAERDVNLTRIESRPLRQRLGEYMFFLDLEGAADDAGVSAAVTGLRSHAEVVRVLGSFPAA
jgi:prephenate dehydratase